MKRSIILIALVAALAASLAANVVAFTRAPSDVRNGSINLQDLAPDVKDGLRGETGETGLTGTRGPKGERGEQGFSGPSGADGADGIDLTYEVEALQSQVDDLCSSGLIYGLYSQPIAFSSPRLNWYTMSC